MEEIYKKLLKANEFKLYLQVLKTYNEVREESIKKYVK